jgi:hypothetical protein
MRPRNIRPRVSRFPERGSTQRACVFINESQAIFMVVSGYCKAVMMQRPGLTAQEIAELRTAITEAPPAGSPDPASSTERRLGGELNSGLPPDFVSCIPIAMQGDDAGAATPPPR